VAPGQGCGDLTLGGRARFPQNSVMQAGA